MKKAVFLLLVLLNLSMDAIAQIPGDANNDGKVGLSDAIYALQVSAGTRAQAIPNTIDVRDYMGLSTEGEKFWKYTTVQSSAEIISYRYAFWTHELLDGKDVQAVYNDFSLTAQGRYYYGLDNSNYVYLGNVYYYQGKKWQELWYSIPIVMGKTEMKIGDTFATCSPIKSP